eukprot:scaffold22262_cov73-Isochrysis_galbana.AAC.1
MMGPQLGPINLFGEGSQEAKGEQARMVRPAPSPGRAWAASALAARRLFSRTEGPAPLAHPIRSLPSPIPPACYTRRPAPDA